jgi:hypothetical protein
MPQVLAHFVPQCYFDLSVPARHNINALSTLLLLLLLLLLPGRW